MSTAPYTWLNCKWPPHRTMSQAVDSEQFSLVRFPIM